MAKKIDKLGRIVIPKEMRDLLGIKTDDALEFSVEGDRISVRKHNAENIVEVVRCKDCEYGEIDENGNTWCTFYNGRIREMPNGYCWHGKRRNNDERE